VSNGGCLQTIVPATAEDHTVIQQHINNGDTSLPAYLINVRPEIRLEDQAIATGASAALGTTQYWTLTTKDPLGLNTRTDRYTVGAGDELVFGINGSGISADAVVDRLATRNSVTAAENLHQAILHYWLEHDLFDRIAAKRNDVIQYRMPSAGLASAPLTVNYFFGLPRTAYYQSRQLDVKRVLLSAVAPSRAALKNFAVQAGTQGSFIEGSVFDQLFTRPGGTSVSSSRLLELANRQNVRIYTVTAANLTNALSQISVTAEVEQDISNAVYAGMTAVVQASDIENKGYVGTGYILMDPDTGMGAYLIDGGLNGGSSPDCGPGLEPPADDIAPIALGLLGFVGDPSKYAPPAKQALKRLLLLTLARGVVLAPIGPAIAVTLAIIMAVAVVRMVMQEAALERAEDDVDCRCEGDLWPDDCQTCESEYPFLKRCDELPNGYQCSNELEATNAAEAWTGISPLQGEGSITRDPPCPGQGTHVTLFDATGRKHPASVVSCECCNDYTGVVELDEWWAVVEVLNDGGRRRLTDAEIKGTGQCSGRPF